MKAKPVIDENSRKVEEVLIPSERKIRNIKRIGTSIIRWNTVKYLNY